MTPGSMQTIMGTKKGDFVSVREKIIMVSIESLRQEGLRFSVDTLAEKLGVSKKTIYKFFPDKEALALALYEKYYSDARRHAEALSGGNIKSTCRELLFLYFDAKTMVRNEIFNKYKLNEKIYAYTKHQNDALWELICDSLSDGDTQQGRETLRVIVDGSFEKLCNAGLAPDAVIERLVQLL